MVKNEIEISHEDVIGVQRKGYKSFDVKNKENEFAKYEGTLEVYVRWQQKCLNGKVVIIISVYKKLTIVLV